MHIHPEARPEATNKVLTAYVEGGGDSSTPMRSAGLDGSGEVIGVTDTGLDDHSCFFRDDENGLVPRRVGVGVGGVPTPLTAARLGGRMGQVLEVDVGAWHRPLLGWRLTSRLLAKAGHTQALPCHFFFFFYKKINNRPPKPELENRSRKRF